MSPTDASTVSDQQSEISRTGRRGRPPFPRELVLAAADGLFSDAEAPGAISMDDVAAAAGIGKGTLFRAFGSRDGLLDALFVARCAPLREAVESGPAPLGPATPPRRRALALLDAGLTFKLENRHLTRARESDGAAMLASENYRWSHGTLVATLTAAGATADDADFTAHVLLGALRPEVIDAQLTAGRSPQEVRRRLRALAGAAIDAVTG